MNTANKIFSNIKFWVPIPSSNKVFLLNSQEKLIKKYKKLLASIYTCMWYPLLAAFHVESEFCFLMSQNFIYPREKTKQGIYIYILIKKDF
jgi:hypothetical protein